MPLSPTSTAPLGRLPRSDGVEARSRLLQAALGLFAEKGFAKTSTREIAQAAGANIAAISYYFGDKAGLYAACFTEPMGGNVGELIAQFDVADLPLEAALHIFMAGYLEPLKHGETVRQCMRLHMRELVDPTNQFLIEIDRDIKGPHEALMRVLCRHLGLTRADDDIHRLAISVMGLTLQLFVMQDVIDMLNPVLLSAPGPIDTWADRMVRYALAMVAAEADRRSEAPPPPRADSTNTPKRAATRHSKRQGS
ncbi:MAG: CerR family C-terminal domain-containing protein [Pseudomonadota bacterium]